MHELSLRKDGKAEMFYYGERPWHGLGTPVETALTSEEALVAANLDWPVTKRQIYIADNAVSFKPIKGFATVRADTNTALGIVGKDYIPIQNAEAFDFVDTLVLTRDAKYHTAGALFGGQIVFILAKLPSQIVVKGDDTVDKYLLIATSHNGKWPLKAFFTKIRVVCFNTLKEALSRSSTVVNIHHRGNVYGKIEEARRILGIAHSHFDEMQQIYRDFAEKDLTTAQVETYINDIFPGEHKRAETTRERVRELHETGVGVREFHTAGTVWGLYNATTEFIDHHKTDYNKYPDRYLETINFGRGAEIKAYAFDKAVELTYGAPSATNN